MFLIIDGSNWFAQCDYASPDSGTRNLLGRLETLRGQVEHSLVAVCWDDGDSFRTIISSKYKAHRAAKPDGYHTRMSHAQVAVGSLAGVLSLSQPSYEADDLIATLVRCAHDEGERAVIFSADRDLHQLLVPGRVTQVTQVNRISRVALQFVTMTAERLEQKYQVTPEQWIDFRAIIGDKSDGIDGCPGLGAIAAANVLRCCGTLDGFYRSPLSPKLSQRQRDALLSYRPELPDKRRLLALCDDCTVALGAMASLRASAGEVSP